tara:strand:+ start:5061 stop:6329 length:1269 start_codon:yes stop_codon:yes gene_type:complete
MNKYDKCINTTSTILKKRGFDNPKAMAEGMCNLWAEENGVEREFGTDKSLEPVSRSFALSLDSDKELTLTSEEGIDTVSFPVIAITSGLHEYEDEDGAQKVYIEPNVLKEHMEVFKELPIYVDHQRTPEDLIGMAVSPEVIEMENGKTAIQMLAMVSNKYGRGQEVMDKVKEGDMTHVSIDWLSNDVDVMGSTFATNITPTEVSFIDNEKMDPVCKECTIEAQCKIHTTDEDKHDHDCGCGGHEDACDCEGKTNEVNMTEEVKEKKSDAENIVEREFASLRTQLEEAQAANVEIKSAYEEALKSIETFKEVEEARLAAEAEERKAKTIEAVISKELLLGTSTEESKASRLEELTAWDEMKLTGFSEALAVMPVQELETERSFGKGKATAKDAEVEPSERKFGIKVDKRGTFRLNPAVYNRGE